MPPSTAGAAGAAGGQAYDPYATQVYPAVGHPGQRPTAAPRRSRQRAGPGGDGPAWAPVLMWTIGCFAVPVLLYLAWAATRSGAAPDGCLDPGSGLCRSSRKEAVTALMRGAPGLVGALLLAVLVAAGLRRLAATWRAGTVGLAAAVIGAGVVTMIASAFG